MNHERLKSNVLLWRSEIDILAWWHRDRENEYAAAADYQNALIHKARADELFRSSEGLIRRSEAAE
jgi:hypothetical protein